VRLRTLLGDAGLGVEWRFLGGEDSEESLWLMLLAREET
jgi:hypothetical protein